MSNNIAKNEDGYIVYNDSGTSPLTYGASEQWFPTYDRAMKEEQERQKQSELKQSKKKSRKYLE